MAGYVYLICDPANDMYKIGVTRNIESNRIKKLQTGNPTELHIVHIYETKYPFRMEKMLHSRYMLKRELNEWFKLELNDIVNFKSMCERIDNEILLLLDNPYFAKDLH